MKIAKVCPKCGCTEVAEIPASIYSEQDPRIRAGAVGSVPLIRYVCCGCGYVEQWVDPKEFTRIAKGYWDKKAKAERDFQSLDDYWRERLKEKKENSKGKSNRDPWEE